ncbi:MAG: hypothetical protein ABIP30_14805 [Ferruginibacter sp.]
MKYLPFIFLLTVIFGCYYTPKHKAQSIPTTQHTALPHFTIVDAAFPLKLSLLNLQDTTKNRYPGDDIENKISQTVSAYYFDECAGDSSETSFKIKDIYINTIHLRDSLYSIYLVLLKYFPTEEVNSKVLIFDNQSKTFIDKPLDFNLHALYDFSYGKLSRSNLKINFNINTPEIEVINNKTGPSEFKFNRLYHIGTANAFETTIIKITGNKIDTTFFNLKWI